MTLMDPKTPPPNRERAQVPIAVIDAVLAVQLVVAWAGENGDEPRLGWWRTDLVSEYGGKDLLRRLLPHTWEWAVFQAVRESARRQDADLRSKDHDADNILSLFRLGVEIDERLDERLQDHKRSGSSPLEALPGLKDGIQPNWDRAAFRDWVVGHGNGKLELSTTPVGRCLKGPIPTSLELMVRQLVGALAPLSDAYPLPHFRSGR